MAQLTPIYLGIKGAVVALNSADGSQLWVTPLKSCDFVNIALGEDVLYATTRGEIFCLDPKTGEIRWNNPLTGFGWGLVTIAGRGLAQNDVALAAHKRRQEQQNSSASAA